MNKKEISGAELAVGGQAVMEGVLMRGLDSYNVSVRNDSGKIISKKTKLKKQKGFSKVIRKTPFIRGLFALVDSLKIGYSALNYSAKIVLGEDEDSGSWLDYLMIPLAILIAVGLFKFLPYSVPLGIEYLVGHKINGFVIIEGVAKAFVFVLYLLLISLMSDVKRVFEYHGAEHKTIHCYEKYGKTKSLNIENAMKESRIHKRCGTTFLFLVVFVSIVIYAFLPRMDFLIAVFLRLLLLPLIAGISFEILRLFPKLKKWNPLYWVLLIIEYPGLMLQYITTREPDKKQLEVALHSLKKVL